MKTRLPLERTGEGGGGWARIIEVVFLSQLVVYRYVTEVGYVCRDSLHGSAGWATGQRMVLTCSFYVSNSCAYKLAPRSGYIFRRVRS